MLGAGHIDGLVADLDAEFVVDRRFNTCCPIHAPAQRQQHQPLRTHAHHVGTLARRVGGIDFKRFGLGAGHHARDSADNLSSQAERTKLLVHVRDVTEDTLLGLVHEVDVLISKPTS